jgi:hypothetical protein
MSVHPTDVGRNDFANQATRSRGGAFHEFWTFLRHNKRWWLTPIVIILLLLGLLITLAGTGAAPLIYTLF